MTDDNWIREERKHELQMAEIKSKESQFRRQEIREQIGWAMIALTTVLVVGILATMAWRLTVNSTEQNTQRDKDCVESGGTRVPLSGGPVVCLQLAPVEVE